MKRARILFLLLPLIGIFLMLKGCIIQNPKADDCEVKEITVTKITEGGVLDITFHAENGEFYYINRGLELGLTLEGMEVKVLNKKVTLHLANTLMGTSNHIAQLATAEEVIFTEFTE